MKRYYSQTDSKNSNHSTTNKGGDLFMKNLKVITKMSLIGFSVLAFIVFSICFSINSMNAIEKQTIKGEEKSIRTDYDNSIKNEVELVITLLDSYNADIQDGTYTKEEGMKLAADKIRNLRYGSDGYFWVDQSDGVNVVLLGSDTEGTNRLATKDATGFEMVKDFISNAVKKGRYFSDYQYPKEGETEPKPKRAYTQYYEPFDWVVGTGNYVDHIDEQIAASTKRADQYTMQKTQLFYNLYYLCNLNYFIPNIYDYQHNKTIKSRRN